MKKRDLATLAMIGISAGLIVGGCDKNSKHNNRRNDSSHLSAAEGHMNSDMQTFHDSLSPSAQKKFKELDAQHKMMAMEMANQDCNGKNKCAGMGGCGTDANACAGLNSCKGQGGAPIKNPNKAVEIQHDHQMN